MSISPLLLRRWDLLAHFSDRELERLGECLERRRFAAGSTVLQEGDPADDAFLIEGGEVRIERGTPYGHFSLATLGPGDLFGETSFIDGHVRSGSAVAASELELASFRRELLEPALENDTRLNLSLHWAVWKSLSKKLRLTNDKLTQFFSETGRLSNAPAESLDEGGSDFRVDLADKRKLFLEQKLSSLEINFLSSLSKERKLAPSQVLFREGEIGDSLYVVLEGRVMISKYIPGAGEEALAFLERGDFFGEMALIDNLPRSADAKADASGAVVLAIARNVLEGILDIHKISSINLLRLLCTLVAARLRELDDKIIGWFILAGGSGRS